MGQGQLYVLTSLAHSDLFSFTMSQHKSLQGSSGIVVKRNVLKRFERLELLKKRGQWKPGDRITGLRKTKAEA